MATKTKTPAQIEAAEKRAAKTAAKKAEATKAKAAQDNQPIAGKVGGAEDGKTAKPGAAPVAPTKPKPETGLTITVIGPKKGRWRIGRHFSPEPVEIPLEDLSEDEKQALISDPALSTNLT